MKKNILIIAIVLAVLLITGSYLFYLKSKPAAAPPADVVNNSETADLAKTDIVPDTAVNSSEDKSKIIEDAIKGVLPDIQANPLEEKPNLNPVDKTNPYKNIKTNPFK